MKTPDEIKKGLDFCANHSHQRVCDKCPYDCTTESCIAWMASDALAYIRQLEALVEEQKVSICKVQEELDAAVADLTEIVMACGEPCCKYCSHEKNPATECEDRCWARNEGFEWRGVKEE